MKNGIWLILYFLPTVIYSQQYFSADVGNSKYCPVPDHVAFMPQTDAVKVIDSLLDKLGLWRNFEIVPCDGLKNAVAKEIKIGDRNYRYVFYDEDFLEEITKNSNLKWSSIFVLSHEIAHHLNGHTYPGTPKQELEADYTAGFWLAELGCPSLELAQSTVLYSGNDSAHNKMPTAEDRLLAIQKGWNKSKERSVLREELALEYYQKGETLFSEGRFREALQEFSKSLEAGNIDANYFLSHMYYAGLGVSIDITKAFEYAENGYDKGSVPCVYQLGKYLARGRGKVIQDSIGAQRLFQRDFQFDWFRKNYLKRRVPHYAYVVGFMYREGYGGVKKDEESAFIWYKQAAEQGETLAMTNLGIIYAEGKIVKKNYQESNRLYNMAVDKGEALAMNNLGHHYFHGYGVDQNYQEAFRLFNMAAEKGEATAMNNLGLHYENGYWVNQDYDKATYWYRRAAQNGNTAAKEWLKKWGIGE